ncbi:WD repeat-containing protein-like protein [Saccharata proteae CBS 121410]|uniref:WD repeat-containing protein-like protein n=1 Tax=Saccharata proteae CBS 121410 TaxID=1314787 RepID=A0A9P4HTT7_9PEZI|nr:WD repeat-containing protein-like protein [Saccharata proteae CBS 121410]
MAAGATPNSAAPPTQKISDIVATFRPVKAFRAEDKKTSVTSLDFDESGELAIVARDDDTLQIYNCKEGKHAKELKSQKYGAHLARFTHHSQSIIYASTHVDDGIRYLSTHDNSYIRYFKGHTDKVTCLTVNPSNDTFISCSLDNTLSLWDLKSQNCQGQLKLHAPYLAAYDPSATVIAVASPPTQSILLYDLRNYDKPPFATFDLLELEQRYTPGLAGQSWSKLEFSNDGRSILLGTTGPGHFVLDAFDGALKHFLVRPSGTSSGRLAPGQTPPHYASPGSIDYAPGQGDICMSPDGQYAIGGSGEEGLLVWDVHAKEAADKVLRPFEHLPGTGRGAVVGYNPRSNLVCSADKDLWFWLPDPDAGP